MFYYLSKLALVVSLPSSVCVMLLALGLVLAASERRRRTARLILAAGLAGLIIFGFTPFANWLILPLEERFNRPELSRLPAQPVGIIILGGFENTWISRYRHELAVNEGAERLIEGVLLAQRLPAARVVFTGGSNDLLNRDGAAEIVADYMAAFGVDRRRIVLEGLSRTTAENASMTRDLVHPKKGETWLLVTSAHHMPRAIGAFRRAGFAVTAWPVDYRTAGAEDKWIGFPTLSEGLRRADLGVKEWLGLLGYWLGGRTSELFPAP